MNKKMTPYIVIAVVIIGILLVVGLMSPKRLDWTPTYDPKDKIPLGLYVFDNEAPVLFKNQEIKKFSITPYEYFDERFDYNKRTYKAKGTFISITDGNTIDNESARELLHFAEHGNTVFLSMKDFPQFLMDTLNVKLDGEFYMKDSIQMNLKRYPGKKYWYKEAMGVTSFDSIEKAGATALGYQDGTEEQQPNFIRVGFGDGQFLLHTQPSAFSNFHLLKEDHFKYAENALSYIPDGTIYWYSGFRHLSTSKLRFIKSEPGLKWAWYISLISIIVFIFFNAKRKQRIIPEVKPLKNTTVDFTKTIGNLYYQEGDHHTIIEKKIIYFLEHIRNENLVDTYSLDEAFIEKLHLKTGKPVEDIQKAVSLIKKHRHQFQSNEADVIEINKAIEKLRL